MCPVRDRTPLSRTSAFSLFRLPAGCLRWCHIGGHRSIWIGCVDLRYFIVGQSCGDVLCCAAACTFMHAAVN